MPKIRFCTCQENHECKGVGGFRFFRPTVSWFTERELCRIAASDRNLENLLDLERRRRLGPAQSNELRQQRERTGREFATMAAAAAGQLMATHRCRLYYNSVKQAIESRKASSRMDDDDRRMM